MGDDWSESEKRRPTSDGCCDKSGQSTLAFGLLLADPEIQSQTISIPAVISSFLQASYSTLSPCAFPRTRPQATYRYSWPSIQRHAYAIKAFDVLRRCDEKQITRRSKAPPQSSNRRHRHRKSFRGHPYRDIVHMSFGGSHLHAS